MGVNFVTLVRNFYIENDHFHEDAHDVHDGCVTPGDHRLLRFDFLTYNAGNVDAVIGKPENRPDLFVWSSGHGHYHLKDFNDFKLFNTAGQQVITGTKQAFCLMDLERIDPNSRVNPRYECGDQGISAGWADVYEAALPCQYIVIDNVPDSDYTLRSETNSQKTVREDCYGDNVMWTGLRIKGNSVTEIPLPWAQEDRISLNPDTVEAKFVIRLPYLWRSSWKVVDGSKWLLDCGQDRNAAEQAVATIKHYGLSYICFVGRPSCPGRKPMTYWLTANRQAPTGSMANEDAVGFNLANLQIRKIGQTWKIVDGLSWLLDFGPSEGNAKAALFFIKKYGFTKMCFVGRPNPPMVYFRK